MSGICDTCRRTTCEYRADDIAVCGLPKTETNWERLFGTPERAARTISVTAKCFEPATACRNCMYKSYCDTECDYGKLLDWLRGDA